VVLGAGQVVEYVETLVYETVLVVEYVTLVV
jgi:hypothetical protein